MCPLQQSVIEPAPVAQWRLRAVDKADMTAAAGDVDIEKARFRQGSVCFHGDKRVIVCCDQRGGRGNVFQELVGAAARVIVCSIGKTTQRRSDVLVEFAQAEFFRQRRVGKICKSLPSFLEGSAQHAHETLVVDEVAALADGPGTESQVHRRADGDGTCQSLRQCGLAVAEIFEQHITAEGETYDHHRHIRGVLCGKAQHGVDIFAAAGVVELACFAGALAGTTVVDADDAPALVVKSRRDAQHVRRFRMAAQPVEQHHELARPGRCRDVFIREQDIAAGNRDVQGFCRWQGVWPRQVVAEDGLQVSAASPARGSKWRQLAVAGHVHHLPPENDIPGLPAAARACRRPGALEQGRAQQPCAVRRNATVRSA